MSAPREELIRLVYDLVDQNKALKAQIAELKGRMGNPLSKEKNSVPSFVKPSVKKKIAVKHKERGIGFGRVKSPPTKQVFHSLDNCPKCNGVLGAPSVAYTREIIDTPLPQMEVTEHVVFKRWCTNCGQRFTPKVNLGTDIVGKQRFGTNLTSLVCLLREEFLQPLGKIQNYLKLVYGLTLSEGTLVRFLHTASTLGTTSYGEIKEKIRRAEVVHADETGGRENGRNGYKWNFNTKKVQLLLYRHSRSAKVVSEVLGSEDDKDSFQGVLITDFLGSYNVYQGFHQRCLVHLLRDIHKLKEEHPKSKKVRLWAESVEQIYQEAKSYTGPSPNLKPGEQAKERVEKEAYFKEKLTVICEPLVTRNVPQSVLCARIITFMSELFTFVRFPGVDSDNNSAERAVRHAVLQRKISGGTRSVKGSDTQSVLGSLFGTWRLQGLNPLEQTKLLLAGVPCPGI